MKHTATALFGSVTKHDVTGLVRCEPQRRRKARGAPARKPGEQCGACARPLAEGQAFECPECFEPALCAQHVYECASCGGHRCRRHIVLAVLPPEDTPATLCWRCEEAGALCGTRFRTENNVSNPRGKEVRK